MKYQRSLTYIAIFAIAGLFLMAPRCGSPVSDSSSGGSVVPTPSEPITLEYWRLWDDEDVLDDFIAEYEKKHKNVNIEVKKYALSGDKTVYDYQAEIIKLIADGSGPDMFMIHNTWLPYQINQISPMPESILSTKEYRDIYPEVVEDDFIDNNRIYAVPYYMDNLMLIYNSKYFDRKTKPPRTLDELAETAQKLTHTEDGVIKFSGLIMGGTQDGMTRGPDILAALMMQYGAEMTLADKKTPAFNLPSPNTDPPFFGAEQALAYYTQFADPKSVYYSFTDERDAAGNRLFPNDTQAFWQEDAAMMIGYSYNIDNIRMFNPNISIETAPLPQNRIQEPVTIANYWGETVSKNSEYAAVAWDFINFVSSKRKAKSLAKKINRVPAREDLISTWEHNRYYGPVAQQMGYSRSWYHTNTVEVEAIFSKMIEDVVKYNISPKIAIDDAVRKLKRL